MEIHRCTTGYVKIPSTALVSPCKVKRIAGEKVKAKNPKLGKEYLVHDFKGDLVVEGNREAMVKFFGVQFYTIAHYLNKDKRMNGLYYITTKKETP